MKRKYLWKGDNDLERTSTTCFCGNFFLTKSKKIELIINKLAFLAQLTL